jgi:rhodanese-related sulfurtransferase
MKKYLICILMLLLIMTGCQTKVVEEPSTEIEEIQAVEQEVLPIPYGDIQVTDVAQVIEENPDVVLLDVRTVIENEEGAIPNSVVIPVQELEARIGELDKETKYIVYCRSGNRSGEAMRILEDAEFTKLFHMLGGMNKYRKEFP